MNSVLLLSTLVLAIICVATVYLSNHYHKQLERLRFMAQHKATAELGFLARLSHIVKVANLHPSEDVKRVGTAINELSGRYSEQLRAIPRNPE